MSEEEETVEHTKKFEECFRLCKNVLMLEPVFAYPDFEKEFELTTDASNFAIGGGKQPSNMLHLADSQASANQLLHNPKRASCDCLGM